MVVVDRESSHTHDHVSNQVLAVLDPGGSANASEIPMCRATVEARRLCEQVLLAAWRGGVDSTLI
jgi:hypothetical protein